MDKWTRVIEERIKPQKDARSRFVPECPQWMRRRCNQMLIKGRRLLAERIREVSEKAGVPYPPTRGRRNQYLELAVRRRKEAKQMRHGRDMLFGAVKYLDKEKL